jgi:hypothetical protein
MGVQSTAMVAACGVLGERSFDNDAYRVAGVRPALRSASKAVEVGSNGSVLRRRDADQSFVDAGAVQRWHMGDLSCRAGSRAVSALLLVATCTALFMAWPVRNEREMHAFIPMRSNFGYELWQGNRTGSDGKFSAELHPNVNAQEFTRYAALGEVDYMREKSTVAKAAIRAQPGRFVELTGKRFVQFWLGLGSHQTSALIVLHIVATTVLGLAGFVLLWRRRRGLALLFAGPMLFFPLPYYITHADFRFRLILDPLATVLCAYAVAQWMGRKQGAGSPRTNLGYRGTRE